MITGTATPPASGVAVVRRPRRVRGLWLLVAALEADPLLSQMPAVANGAIVALPGTSPLGTAANPTPLSISWILDDYLELLAQAADKAA